RILTGHSAQRREMLPGRKTLPAPTEDQRRVERHHVAPAIGIACLGTFKHLGGCGVRPLWSVNWTFVFVAHGLNPLPVLGPSLHDPRRGCHLRPSDSRKGSSAVCLNTGGKCYLPPRSSTLLMARLLHVFGAVSPGGPRPAQE